MKNSRLIGFSAIIISLSIGYYFAVFLPAKKTQELLIKNERDAREELAKNQAYCSETEKKVFSDFLALGNDSRSSSSINHYNQKLKKCIVEISTISSTLQYSTHTINVIDGTENKTLIWGQSGSNNKSVYLNYIKNSDGEMISKEDFFIIEHQYMSE